MKTKLMYIALLSLFMAACKAKPLSLRMNLQAGQEYEITTTASQTATMTAYGQEITYDQYINLSHIFRVDSLLPDSQYLFNGYLKSIRMEVKPKSNKGLVQGFIYNSEDKSENKGPFIAFSYIFSKFLKKPYEVRANNLGDVLMNTKNDVIKAIGIDTVAESKDALQDDFTTLFAVLPEKPVSVNDTYTRNYNSGQDNHMQWDNVYTVKEINENEVVVSYTGKIVSKENNSGQAAFNGEQTGTLYISRENGLVNTGNSEIHLEVKSGDGMNLSPKISGKVTYTCKKIK